MEKILDWVLEWENPMDWQYSAVGITVDDLENLNGRKVGQLNQWKYAKSKSACTIVNAYKELCYLWDKECTETEMLEVIDYCIKEGKYKVWFGRYIHFAMKHVANRRNTKYPDKLSSYFLVKRDDEDFQKILDKWQMLGCTYRGNNAYNKDFRKDCILNGSQFGSPTYWHRTSIRKKDWKINVEDSYAGNVYNTYELQKFQELIQNSVYAANFYLYTKQVTNLEEISRLNKMKVNCESMMTAAMANKILSNDPIYQSECQEIRHKANDKLESIKQRLLAMK